ncbi:hypothetical protein [Labilibaculum manganireducens]|uniref:hypothetical protein n=1 Tax=Labilibaculum manganireducens TaxID=1940525 RepID=UPI0029F59D1C|nr:hypothetical protein [Labilibaculum manganireducens]
MKRLCQIDFDTQGDDYFSMVSSPETSSGQAIWQIKTNYNHMKRPCQGILTYRKMIIPGVVSSIWQLKNK